MVSNTGLLLAAAAAVAIAGGSAYAVSASDKAAGMLQSARATIANAIPSQYRSNTIEVAVGTAVFAYAGLALYNRQLLSKHSLFRSILAGFSAGGAYELERRAGSRFTNITMGAGLVGTMLGDAFFYGFGHRNVVVGMASALFSGGYHSLAQ